MVLVHDCVSLENETRKSCKYLDNIHWSELEDIEEFINEGLTDHHG